MLLKDETTRVLSGIHGPHQGLEKDLFGPGVRLFEGLRLRVIWVDFE
jgi:hypothetical protein